MGERLVLDTNILVSALGWRGAPYQIVQLCLNDQYTLLLSPEILEELERVLRYPKLKFTSQQVDDYLEQLTEAAELVQADQPVSAIVVDPTDNRFLECALTGKADVIVSGDTHLLELQSFQGIPIVRPQAFIERRMGKQGSNPAAS